MSKKAKQQIVKTDAPLSYRSMTPSTRTPRRPTLSIPTRTPPRPSSTSMLVSAHNWILKSFSRAQYQIPFFPVPISGRAEIGKQDMARISIRFANREPGTSFESPPQFNLVPLGPPAGGKGSFEVDQIRGVPNSQSAREKTLEARLHFRRPDWAENSTFDRRKTRSWWLFLRHDRFRLKSNGSKNSLPTFQGVF